MGVRDDELKRLTQYANAMGVKVSYKPYDNVDKSRAEWAMDGTEIFLYAHKRDSKLSTILALIHELGHHVSFIHDDGREHSKSLLRALGKDRDVIPLTKKQRYLILKTELDGMHWWEIIYNETKMSFPIYRLHLEREYDTWWYTFFYQTGREATRLERSNKVRQLREAYRAKIKGQE